MAPSLEDVKGEVSTAQYEALKQIEARLQLVEGKAGAAGAGAAAPGAAPAAAEPAKPAPAQPAAAAAASPEQAQAASPEPAAKPASSPAKGAKGNKQPQKCVVS